MGRACGLPIFLPDRLSTQNCVVRTGGHEEQHGHRQESVAPGSQECLTGENRGVGWWTAGERSLDYFLIVRPNYSPHVKQHDETESPTNTNRQDVIIVLTNWREVQK